MTKKHQSSSPHKKECFFPKSHTVEEIARLIEAHSIEGNFFSQDWENNHYNCGVEYQPIINIKDNSIYGYEALARFKDKDGGMIPTEKIFHCPVSKNELFMYELLAKSTQLNHRPKNKKLFLNLSPYGIQDVHCQDFWVNFFINEENIVLEILEEKEALRLLETKRFITALEKEGLGYAIDDMFQDGSIFCSNFFINAPIVKLDKSVLERIKQKRNYAEFIKGIVAFCRVEDKLLILEGIETVEDLSIAKELGVTYTQGFYYRSRFINK